MKRILYVLVALLSLYGFSANAQQINVDIGSANGEVGDVVLIPVYVQLPAGSQTVNSYQGAIKIVDPTVAQILSVTSPVVSFGNLGSEATFAIPNTPASNFNGLFAMLEVKIHDLGCTNIVLGDVTSPSNPLEISIDGVLYDDLATDFNVSTGQVCGFQDCLCDFENITLGPVQFVQNSDPAFCSSHTISIPPVTTCDAVKSDDSYSIEVFNANGDFLYANPLPTNGMIYDFPTPGIYTIVFTYTIEDNLGCKQTITHTEEYVFAGCDGCPCDPAELSLGPITVTPSTEWDCSEHTISVPPVEGCEGLLLNGSYNYVVTDAWGNTIANVLNTQATSIDVALPYQAQFFVHVQYNFTDLAGCVYPVTASTSFFYAGCDCQLQGPPANPSCQLISDKDGQYQLLSWDPVPSAISYEFEITTNDPNCCAGVVGPVITSTMSLTSTSLTRPSDGSCFSWRVRAVCANGSTTDWSSSVCSCGLISSGGPGFEKSMVQSDDLKTEQLELITTPNPATNHVDISLSGISIDVDSEEMELFIYDMSGKQMYQSSIHFEETKRVNIGSFNSGMYIVKIVNNGAIVSTKKLIVE